LEVLLEALYQSAPAEWMRYSRWGYASVNAAHILGIALLVGAIVPFDLRLAGAWRHVPLDHLSRVLVPVAATGLAIAMATGSLLFVTRAMEYAAVPLFLFKMGLVAAGVVHALVAHSGKGIAGASARTLRRTGITSMLIWLCVLVMGRMLAFVTD